MISPDEVIYKKTSWVHLRSKHGRPINNVIVLRKDRQGVSDKYYVVQSAGQIIDWCHQTQALEATFRQESSLETGCLETEPR